jgi:formylglycine-generating enzyme required for sulfatase activity
MGSTEFYPEEGPVVERKVSTFQVATRPVTNWDFLQFVESTGYVTTAEQSFDLGVGSNTGGSLCFRPSTEPVDLSDWTGVNLETTAAWEKNATTPSDE